MKYSEYKSIYERLNSPKDVARLAEETSYDLEFLNVIYTQKTVREITKRFYKVRRHTDKMLRDWKRGRSMLEIAEKYDFSPILTGLFIFQQDGLSKKQFWSYVRNPEKIKDEGMRREIIEITMNDFVYSPWANDQQRERGEWGEGLLQEWLDKQGISYRTEKDLRGEYQKTPDCLFDEPLKINGWKVNWIESKASFGDNTEIRKNIKKQLLPYVELFGRGLVVYWFGYLDDFRCPEGISITDDSILSWECKKP